MKILNYTRVPLEDAVYANRLAYSMHLALQEEDGSWLALNHNSGVLFVKATENEDGSLNPKSLKSPCLFPMRDGGYGVVAIRTQAEGEADNQHTGSVIFWTTPDLLRYREMGRIDLESAQAPENPIVQVSAAYSEEREAYVLRWTTVNGEKKSGLAQLDIMTLEMTRDGLKTWKVRELREDAVEEEELTGADFPEIPGCVPHNIVEISNEEGEYLRKKLTPAVHCGTEVPRRIEVSSREELEKVRVKALYSDGGSVDRKVIWSRESLEKIDFDKPGEYELEGRLYRPHFAFPLAINRADPCVCRWQGKYYFIATNDADNNHTLYMRAADTLEGLADAEEHLILDSETYEDIGGLLWAPEFHVIDGRMYIFHAATPEPFFCEESHLIALKEGGDPLKKEDWSRPRRIVRADGSDLCEAGKEITLDMTEFEWQGEIYVVWSQRQFLPKDLGAWLYIAKLDREDPYRLACEPVVLSKPEYGWANNHTFVDEGPFALIRGDKLYVTFSSAAVDSTYVVGLLTIEAGLDPMVPTNWRKTNYPLFTSRSLEGEYGTGHNAYVEDEDGIIWNTYHARPGIDGPRSSGIRRVHFDVDGEPMLDVTEELDLTEEFATVRTTLVVKK